MSRLLAFRVVAGAAIAWLALALGACSLLPAVGVSRDQAIAVALDRAKLANAVMFSAEEGGWSLGSEPRRAWIVTIRGNYLDCESINDRRPSEFERCQMVAGQAIIYVDLTTGEFLGGNVGGPIAVPEGP
jgi:hypothetical protein